MTFRKRQAAVFVAFGVLLSTPLAAVDLPRGVLWRVVQTCVLNQRTTGSPFPCLQVDLGGGYAVLRAPFRQTHVVAMPITRVIGIEDPALRRPDAPPYFAEAWTARHFVQEELKRPLGSDDIGLAVNSRFTRSQDQLHIHIDCTDRRVKRDVAARLASIPSDRWQADGYVYLGQSYWTRRIDKPTLQGVDIVGLVEAIPPLKAHPDRISLAVLGVRLPDGHDGFVVLAAQSNARRGGAQATGEDLLDHDCRRDG